MKVLTTRDDASLTRELAAAGHELATWALDKPAPAAQLAIVYGLDEVVRAAAAPFHLLAIVEPADLDHLAVYAPRLSDFAVAPTAAREVAVRVQRICTRPSWSRQQLNELMVLAVERTSDVVEITDPSARFQYVNAAYKTAVGIDPAEAIGKTPAQLVRSTAHTPEFFRALDRTLAAGQTWSGTLISKARDGRMVHFATAITPIANADGRITHHMAVKRDITDEIQQRQALSAAQAELETARDAAQRLEVEQAIMRAKRDEALTIANRVQMSILPRALEIPGYQLTATMLAATEVGGDYYDLHVTPEAAWLAIGDVAGHGLDAGLVMMMVQSAMAAIVRARPEAAPRDMVQTLNHVLFENIQRLGTKEHVTFTLFRIDPDGRVTFAGAHEEIVVWRAQTRTIERIQTPGVWLGPKRDIASVTVDNTFQLESGDLLLLHTDGFTEARDERGRQLELLGLCSFLEEVVDAPVEQIRDHLVARTRTWMSEQRDDMSIVLVRRA